MEEEQESSDPAREGGSLSSLRADFDKIAWQSIKTKKHCHTEGLRRKRSVSTKET